MDTIHKFVLSQCPNYDFDRRHYSAGDVVKTLDDAVVVVEYSTFEYVTGYVIKRSLKYRTLGEQRVSYEDLPYEEKGSTEQYPLKVNTSFKWNLYDVIIDTSDFKVLLYEERGHQAFYVYVLSCPEEFKYYKETHIYIVNPYRDYVAL